MVARWDSNVGYAWWLMESYWVVLANTYQGQFRPILAYPSISEVPARIRSSDLELEEVDFSRFSLFRLLPQLLFLLRNRIRVMYLTDKPAAHWSYVFFRCVGVRRIVVHDHTPGVRTTPKGVKRVLKRLLNLIPGFVADCCIGASEFVRDRFVQVRLLDRSRCHTVANGIPLEMPLPESIHEAFSIDHGKQVIVTAARAHPYKGGSFALEVLAVVAERIGREGWHYVYFGDGPGREDLIRQADRLGLADNVSFPGRVEGVVRFFPSASFAFHPSQGEVGYSLAILEYMLAELPVVVPDNPSVCGATVHEKTGYIYPEGDVVLAAQRVIACLEAPEKIADAGRTAAQTVKQHYSLDEAHQSLVKVFDQTLGIRQAMTAPQGEPYQRVK